MSGLWTGTPTTIRLEDLDIICSVLMFGLSITGANRYSAVLAHPDLQNG